MTSRLTSSACLLTLSLAGLSSAQVQINEIRISQLGPDSDEYVELLGTPGTNLSGYTYLVIGNDDFQLPPSQNGYVEEVITLSGTIPASGLFVIAKASFTLGIADLTAAFSFEDGNNKTHLLVQGFTGGVGDDLDTDDDGSLDSTPWNSIEDSIALIQFPNPDGVVGDFVYSADTIGPDAGVVPAQVWRCGDTNAWRIGFSVVGLTDTPGAANPACRGGSMPILISEIRIDQTGTDNDEYFELSGAPAASLDGLTYIVIGDGTGGSGVIEAIVPLTGSQINASGLFLVTETTFTLGATPDLIVGATGLNFENSDNVTHMLVRNFTGANAQDLDTNNDGVLDATPWDEIVDWVSLVKTTDAAPRTGDEWWYSPTRVGPDGIFIPGHVSRCQPNGDWQIGNFDIAALPPSDTPGVANLSCDQCGVIGTGNCFQVHAGSGCQDGDCCDAVCKFDPSCCSTGWDAACVAAAQNLCHADGSPPAVVINEIRIDQPGIDQDEFFELRGPSGVSLNGVAYVVIGRGPGNPAGVVESVTKLDGYTIASDGFLLVAKPAFTLGVADVVVPANGFNFASDSTKTHLLVWNVETIRGEDLDFDNDCALDQAGWVSIMDQVVFKGPDAADCSYGAPAVGPDCNGFAPASLFRCLRTDVWTIGSFGTGPLDTPGASNASCNAEFPFTCGDACAGDCRTVHGNAHCSNATCCEAVCMVLPACCESAWDADCVAAANSLTACGGGAAPVRINELRIDETGTDFNEYVELTGAAGTSLDGLTYVVIGDGTTVGSLSGVVEYVLDLSGFSLNASGLHVIAEKTLAIGVADRIETNLNFENTDNVTHMIVSGFTGAVNDDLDTNDDGVLDSVPWSSVLDSIALVSTTQAAPAGASEWWYSARIGPDGGTQPGQIFRCTTKGYWQIGAFNPVGGNDTVGAENPACPGITPCPVDLNGDQVINGADLGLVLAAWGQTGGAADLNGDMIVNGADLGLVLAAWGDCP